MFKSVFGKYLSAFIAIILVFFSLLLVIVMGVINQYATSLKEQSVVQTANALREYIKDEMREMPDAQQEAQVLNAGNINHLVSAIRLAITSSDDFTVILTDSEVRVF